MTSYPEHLGGTCWLSAFEQCSDSGRGGVSLNGLNIWSVGRPVWTLAEPVEFGHILFGVVQGHLDEIIQRRFASGACQWSKARGSAKVSGNAVEMKGEYYQPTGPCRPTYLSYSLTRAGDVLEGTGIGAANRPFRVSWKKVT